MTSNWGESKYAGGRGCHPKGPRQAGGRGQQEPHEIQPELHLKSKNPRHRYMLRTDGLAQFTEVFSYKDTIFAGMGRRILVLISPFVLSGWSYPPKLWHCREWYNCHQPSLLFWAAQETAPFWNLLPSEQRQTKQLTWGHSILPWVSTYVPVCTCKSTGTYFTIFSTINKRFEIKANILLWIFILFVSKLINLEERTMNNRSLNYSAF